MRLPCANAAAMGNFSRMRALYLVLVVAVIAACGGGGGGTSSGGGGASISDAERTAIITALERKVENLTHPGQTAAQLNDAVFAYMKTVPQFSSVGKTTEECVWGRFSDGRYIVVGNNRYPERFQRTPSDPPTKHRPAPRAAQVPVSSTARLFHTFGAGFSQQQNPINEMAGWLRAAGYSVDTVQDGDGRLATLRSIAGTGFLYINSHGGSFVRPNGTKVYMVLSSTLKSPQNELLPNIAADMADESIVYGTYTNGLSTVNDAGETVPARDTRYGFTSKFVDKYWALGQNSIVFLNVCWSGYTGEPGAAQDMIKSLKAKGAAMVIGWSGKSFSPASEDVPQLLVDRLCGSNQYMKESPDQRPFFVEEIFAEMRREGVIPSNGSDIVLFPKSGVTNAGLRPTIHYLDMSEPMGTLDLYGRFGDVEGEVFVNGVKATVSTWANEGITVRIPDTGAGSFGDVTVKVNNKVSNIRTLTKWVTNATFTEKGQGSLKCVVTAKIVIRADLADRRGRPGDPVTLIDPIPVFASRESTCSFVASGNHSNGPTVIEAWAGSGTVPLFQIPFTAPQAGWFCNGGYDPVTREFALGFMCGGPKRISGQVGNANVMAGGASYLGIMSPLWFAPAVSVAGSTSYSFSAMSPQSPVRSDQYYRPLGGR